MKKCRQCKKQKTETEFHKRLAEKDGLNKFCKDCENANKRRWYEANKEHVRAQKRRDYDSEKQRKRAKEYYYANREKEIERAKRWNKKNPIKRKNSVRKSWEKHKEKYYASRKKEDQLSYYHKARSKSGIKFKAREALRRAVKKGEIKRKECEYPGCSKLGHGHHWDYQKPLEVTWLCPKHHAIADKTTKYIQSIYS